MTCIPQEPDLDKIRPLSCEYGGFDSPFQYLLQYGDTYFHLLLCFEHTKPGSVVNLRLQTLYDSIEKGSFPEIEDAIGDCTELFWSFLLPSKSSPIFNEFRQQSEENMSSRSAIPIQLVSAADGVLRAVPHEHLMSYSQSRPVPVMFEDVSIFKSQDLVYLGEIDHYMLKVQRTREIFCVKQVYRSCERSFLRELDMLRKARGLQNVMPLVGVVEARSEARMIDGIVMPYIANAERLSDIKVASTKHKEKWIRQISLAITALHKAEVVWGDAKPSNILIDPRGDDILIADFGGGWTEGWVPENLRETIEGDTEGLSRILKFLDALPTTSGRLH